MYRLIGHNRLCLGNPFDNNFKNDCSINVQGWVHVQKSGTFEKQHDEKNSFGNSC